ncbi:hypothetical protein, partial [uncultured Thiodictyon sp.]|uniref:hypothetical protein n=1 Tax=uncultured Thiodictyon sp. TaxID=1846217 RepID=UPI00345BC207
MTPAPAPHTATRVISLPVGAGPAPVRSGGLHTCALATDGTAACWGYNWNGQLGNGTNTDSWVPVAGDRSGVLNGKTLAQVSAGLYHTCALATDG